jgi:hypothetical protein
MVVNAGLSQQETVRTIKKHATTEQCCFSPPDIASGPLKLLRQLCRQEYFRPKKEVANVDSRIRMYYRTSRSPRERAWVERDACWRSGIYPSQREIFLGQRRHKAARRWRNKTLSRRVLCGTPRQFGKTPIPDIVPLSECIWWRSGHSARFWQQRQFFLSWAHESAGCGNKEGSTIQWSRRRGSGEGVS